MTRSARDRHAQRAARGVLVTLGCAALAVSAHGLGDGTVPHVATTVLLSGLVGWISTAVADRLTGLTGVLLTLGAGQLLTHVALVGASGHPAGGLDMVASHAGATVLTAVLLARAESMLAVATAALRRMLPVVPWQRPGHPEQARPAAVRSAVEVPAIAVLLCRMHGRRGPPVHS